MAASEHGDLCTDTVIPSDTGNNGYSSKLMYRVWYGEKRDDRFPIDSLASLWILNPVSKCSVERIKEKALDPSATHMVVWGDIPPNLDLLVPQLTHLAIQYVGSESQMESLGRMSKLEKLEVLYLSGIDFSTSGLPDSLFSLTSLRQLYLTSCELDDLPLSLRYLENLEVLDIGYNVLPRLPAAVCELRKLKKLYLNANVATLRSLDTRISKLHELELVDVSECKSLNSPPYEVCQQGIHAIRQYYIDLSKGVGKNIPMATIAVIGQTLAGKTSLIRTLQSATKERVLTKRGPEVCLDEATKVFNYEDVKVDSTVLKFIDLGGHEVYHLTYQLTLKQNCVPVIVVSIEQFEQLSQKDGEREAVRRLFFDWMSHLYLAQPDLGSPKLVLTHKDKYSEVKFDELATQFLTTTDSLRDSIVIEEAKLKRGFFCSIKRLSSRKSAIFKPENIYCIGNEVDDYSVYDKIKQSLHLSCQQYVKPLPKIWEEVDDGISSLTGGFCHFDDLFDALRRTYQLEREQLEIILTYMHACGKLLWYKDVESLSAYVFHKILSITKLLNVLYDHVGDVWEKRIDRFEPTLIGKDVLDEEEYQQLVQQFRDEGIMRDSLLYYLIQSETEFKTSDEADLAIEVLRSFHLMHGPLKRAEAIGYIIPYFSVGYLDSLEIVTGNDLVFRAELQFKGLSLPQYVYHQLTIEFLKLFVSEKDSPVVKQNGAFIFHDGSHISLIHDFKSRKLIVQISVAIASIASCWMLLLDIINNMVEHTLNTWRASRLVCIFYCPHCLLKGDIHPRKTVNPKWCNLGSTLSIVNQYIIDRTKMERVACGRDRNIPSPIKFPCDDLSKIEIVDLVAYVAATKNTAEDALSSLGDATGAPDVTKNRSQVPQLRIGDTGKASVGHAEPAMLNRLHLNDEGVESDLSDGDEYIYPSNNPDMVSIRLRVRSTAKQRVRGLFANTDKVYKMSKPVRGRALIINNKKFAQFPEMPRYGSEADVENLTDMLRQFRFEVSFLEDLTAKKMLTAIGEETKNADHEDFGMFVLVIMSHGTENDCIYGTDYPKTVKLSDVYDLLSTQHFPLMAGKPKFVVVQACSGARRDHGNKGIVETSTDAGLQSYVRSESHTVEYVTSTDPIQHLNVDDLLVIKSSFESYSSLRHVHLGSLFIRGLVTTFYKHACHRDVWSLCEIIQQRVREKTMGIEPLSPKSAFGQVPVYFKTLTNLRKLYLFPGM